MAAARPPIGPETIDKVRWATSNPLATSQTLTFWQFTDLQTRRLLKATQAQHQGLIFHLRTLLA